MSHIGQLLRSARRDGGYDSINDFLELLRERGVRLARTVVYDSESGRRPPTEATIRAYAIALGRPELLGALENDQWEPLPEVAHESAWVTGSVISGLTPTDNWLSREEIADLEQLAAERPSEGELFVATSRDQIGALVRSLVAAVVCLTLSDKITPGIGSEIYVYQPGDEPGFPGDVTAEEWGPVLTAALKAGLDIVHVRSGFDGPDERHGLSRDLRGLLGYRGRYLPHVLRSDARPPAPSALVSMPTIGTVSFMSVDDPRRCDVAIYYPWNSTDVLRAAETMLWRHTQRCADSAESIIRRFDALEPWQSDRGSAAHSAAVDSDYWWARARSERVLVEVEQQDGIRYLFKDGLSTATCPIDVARARMRRAHLAVVDQGLRPPFSPPIADEFLAIRSDRHREFLSNLRTFEAVDFVTKSSLERYVRTGLFNDRIDDYWGEDATPDEVADHLRFLIGLVEEEPNYHLIVLEDAEVSDLVAPGTSLHGAGWMLKADRGAADRVVFEVVREVNTESNATFVHTICEIRQRTAVRSILAEFQSLRRRFAASGDGRSETIAYLLELAHAAVGRKPATRNRLG